MSEIGNLLLMTYWEETNMWKFRNWIFHIVGMRLSKRLCRLLGLSRLLIRIPPTSVSSVPLSLICQRSYRRLVSRWMRMGRKQRLSQWQWGLILLSALLKDLLSITRLYSPFAKLPLTQSYFWEHTGGYKL